MIDWINVKYSTDWKKIGIITASIVGIIIILILGILVFRNNQPSQSPKEFISCPEWEASLKACREYSCTHNEDKYSITQNRQFCNVNIQTDSEKTTCVLTIQQRLELSKTSYLDISKSNLCTTTSTTPLG